MIFANQKSLTSGFCFLSSIFILASLLAQEPLAAPGPPVLGDVTDAVEATAAITWTNENDPAGAVPV